MPNYLALDLGAESGRAILGSLENDKLVLTETHRFPNGPVHLPEGMYWDILRLWSEIQHAIAVSAAQASLDSLAIDTWGVDFALLDRNGALLANPRHYRDPRTAGMMEEAFQRVPREQIFAQTGIQFMQLNTLYQLLALSRQQPHLLEAAHTFLTIPDLFNYWLSGKLCCEFTNATTTQCFDPIRRAWALPLLEALGIPTRILPPVCQPGTILGHISASDIRLSASPSVTSSAAPSASDIRLSASPSVASSAAPSAPAIRLSASPSVASSAAPSASDIRLSASPSVASSAAPSASPSVASSAAPSAPAIRLSASPSVASSTAPSASDIRLSASPSVASSAAPSAPAIRLSASSSVASSVAPSVLVIAPACHDTGSAVVAVPAEGKDFAWLSSGTWSIMGVEADAPCLDERALAYNFTNEGGVFGTWRVSKNIMGLWLIQECRREWGLSYDEITHQAAEAPAFLAVINPDAEPFFRPGDMPAKIQKFCAESGQNVPHTRGEIARVALESLALKYRLVLERLETITGKRLTPLHIIGGGTKNRLLNQLTADCIGRPVVTGPVEATAIGNILMQAIALGHLPDLSAARALVRRSFDVETFQPAERAGWDETYQKSLRLLDS
ncbi:MAG: hypothetical protein DDG60_00340 [Anaerolineae bacterium]|nr:MAG: hypothetical protein DDG60_00340 [Anaerolineae bacterium]